MQPIAEEIWNLKYRLRRSDGVAMDSSVDETFSRVARAAASVESSDEARRRWTANFHMAMADFGFIPGGRILAGAGSERHVTLFNCFVMNEIPDDLKGIFRSVEQSAITMQMGGGIGLDFSTLRPRGAAVTGVGADASGPVSFMDVWDAMCRTIMSAGARRGAMMGALRADHPDIEEFIDAKSTAGRLVNFNLSVLVPDALIAAVDGDKEWDLVFGGSIYRTLRARDLWERIMRATYASSEPGVIFIDRVNARNNLSYCERIAATNPCGEQPLPPSGACLLGSLNLTAFIEKPFSHEARLDINRLASRTAVAVRFLDNIIDVSRYPLDAQRKEAMAKRRLGLGITGLADALILCGVRYGSQEAVRLAGNWMRTIAEAAYLASAELAEEKGAFPLFDAKAFAQLPLLTRLSTAVQKAVTAHGLRNGCLTTIAPTGTTSLFAGNVSSGIEPVFDFAYKRRILEADGSLREECVEDAAFRQYIAMHGGAPGKPEPPAALPPEFVRAADLTPLEHLEMQAALQEFVDSSISKTVNCPEDISYEEFKDLYRRAFDLGLKGCTTYRPSSTRGAVLVADRQDESAVDRTSFVTHRTNRSETTSRPESHDSASATEVSEATNDGVVYLSQPLQRAPVLSGATYKLKWPGSEHALYVTINDVVRDGRRRPFEIFINTKSLEHYAWTVALTRMISAVFRRGGDFGFVAEELQAIFDPQGGRWLSGRYVPSLQAAIGEIIEGHLKQSDLDGHDDDAAHATNAALPTQAGVREQAASAYISGRNSARSSGSDLPAAVGTSFARRLQQCPRCGAAAYVRREGCWTCERCGYSQCD